MQPISVGLAPMHGVTTFPSRIWFSLASGFDFCSTPFLRVTRGFPVKKISPLFIPELTYFRSLASYRATPQIMASAPEDFVVIAEHFLTFTDEVELNCGCPSPTVFGNGAGSSLLAQTEKFRNFVEKIIREIGPQKLTVKMRTGIDDSQNFVNLMSALSDLPCQRIVVHGRTRKAGYTGHADWNLIHYASTKMPCPVRGSGDIGSWQQFQEQKMSWSCESVIIGRGALRNPWIFAEIKEGRSLPLTLDTLKYALAVWLLLHEGSTLANSEDRPDDYLSMAALAFEHGPCGVDAQRWQVLFERLCEKLWGQSRQLVELETSPRAMGHLKMLWNYLRSGLPDSEFLLPVLRSRSAGDFFEILSSRQDIMASFTIQHHLQHDWVYAGRGILS